MDWSPGAIARKYIISPSRNHILWTSCVYIYLYLSLSLSLFGWLVEIQLKHLVWSPTSKPQVILDGTFKTRVVTGPSVKPQALFAKVGDGGCWGEGMMVEVGPTNGCVEGIRSLVNYIFFLKDKLSLRMARIRHCLRTFCVVTSKNKRPQQLFSSFLDINFAVIVNHYQKWWVFWIQAPVKLFETIFLWLFYGWSWWVHGTWHINIPELMVSFGPLRILL